MAMMEADQAEGRDPGWFSARESHCEHLIYIDNDDPDWLDRCLRQSDCVLLVGDAGQDYDPQLSNPHQELPSSVVQQLVLLHENDLPAGRTRDWLSACPGVTTHHHVRNDTDIARLGRRLTGKANGLVLSGGGARGFAHLGVIRALREANIPIDYIGGASIGAIIGAGLASDWTNEHMLEVYRQCFIDNDPISDWTVPLVSLRAGRKASHMLREAFGERDIEDLPIPFYAVSSNLTEGGLHVHEIGKLWIALRASSALPGVLPPVFANGQVLVDGGVIDNLPVGEMRKRMSGEIIAVDVGGGYRLEAMIEETELPPWWQLIPELF